MFERKDNKKDALLDLDGRLVTLNKRYTVVKDAGVKIQAMVAVRTRPGAPGAAGSPCAGPKAEGWRFRKNASPATDHPRRALCSWIPHSASALLCSGGQRPRPCTQWM